MKNGHWWRPFCWRDIPGRLLCLIGLHIEHLIGDGWYVVCRRHGCKYHWVNR